MSIQNRLTQTLGIEHPILLAPMDLVSGGRLAGAVSQAGGLGLIGGGYGDSDWVDREWERAGNVRVGCGFITWSLAQRPRYLSVLLHTDQLPSCFRSAIRVLSRPLYALLVPG